MGLLDSYTSRQVRRLSCFQAALSVPFTPPGLNVLLNNNRTYLCLNLVVRFFRSLLCASRFRSIFKGEKGSSAINKRRKEMLRHCGIGEFSNETGVLQLSSVSGKLSGCSIVPFLFPLPESYVLLDYHRTCLCLDSFAGHLCKLLSYISLNPRCENKKGVLKCEKGEMQLLQNPEKGRNAMRGEFCNYKEEAYV